MNTLVKRQSGKRGNAVLEFALTWALTSILFTSVFQYGWSMFIYNELMTSVTNGAIYASTLKYDSQSSSAYTTAVQNMVVYGDPTGTNTIPLVPNLATTNVSVDTHNSGLYPTDVTVSINSFMVDAVFGKQTFTGKPRMTVKFIGMAVCTGC